MDRISQLPDFIVHRILSFFRHSPAEGVRMSVLSKTWFHLTASFPFLFFYIEDFTSRQSFFKYVEYTTSRFCHHNIPALELTLNTTIDEPAELDVVNRCLERLLKNGVRELVIDLDCCSSVPMYRLPNILLSVSVLKYLTIAGCDLPSSLMLDGVKFKSLIQLSLEYVPIADEVIQYLTTSCPLLQELHFDGCSGFKRVCISGHQNLQEVKIYYHTPLEIIDIEAPNLSTLAIIDDGVNGAPRMNLVSCKKLTSVTYMGYPLPNSNGFTNFLSNFPFIENLFLSTDYNCNNLKFSSHSLRTLMLHANDGFEEIEFNTPNLVLFAYCGKYQPFGAMMYQSFLTTRHSTHLKACMQCYPDDHIDALWFQKLRLFLTKKNGFKVLNLCFSAIGRQKFTDIENLKVIELPPYELEHVELQLDTLEESSAHIAFVDAVLWCCRPRSLTLRSSVPFEEQGDVVKFTYKKLLEQEDHTSIQIVGPSSSEAQKQLRDLKSLSVGLPRDGKAISFIKEEGTLLLWANFVDTFFTSLVNIHTVIQEEALSQRFADMGIF